MALDALFAAYIEARASKSVHHRDKLRQCRDRFTKLGPKLASDLKHEEFEPVLNKLSASMRNAQLTLLRSVLNFGIKRGYLDTNPLNCLEFADIHKSEVQIIHPETVEAMLRDSLANEPGLLPFLALGFYCGIRPIGELQKMRWSGVSLSENVVMERLRVAIHQKRRSLPVNSLERYSIA